MFSTTTSTNPIQAARNRVTSILLVFLSVAALAGGIQTLISALQTGDWHQYVLAVDSLIMSIGMGITFLMVQRDKLRLAVIIYFITTTVAGIGIASLIAGMGTILSLVVLFIGIFFSIQLLSGRDVLWGVVVAVISGSLIALADLLGRRLQLNVPAMSVIITISAALVIVSFLVYLLTQFRNYAIQSKIITTYLVVALLPIGVLTYLFTQSSRQALTQSANTALLGTAQQVAGTLDNFINNNLDAVRTEAQINSFVQYLSLPAAERATGDEHINTATITDLLIRLARRDPINITSYALVDSRGIDIIDTYQSDIGTNKAERDWFIKVVQEGLPYVSPVEAAETTGELSLYFSAPVRNPGGEILGVLRVRYKASILQELIARSSGLAGEQSFGILLDEHHINLAHGTQPDLILKSAHALDAQTIADLQAAGRLPDLPVEQLSINQPDFDAGLDKADVQPVFSAPILANGEQAVIGMATLTSQPWLVAFAQPEAILYAPITAQSQTASIVSLVITGLVTLLAFIITQQLSRPIIGLTQTAQKIAAGDLASQADVASNDEVGELAQAFNRMTQQLREFIATLEQRVAARTKDLATVAEVGTAVSTILETDKLLQAVVDLTKERFNLYHSHIYLLDQVGENLVLASGAGEPGRQMVAEKRSIPLDSELSLVARAAREHKGVTVNDVMQAPDFLPNPLLPDTRSELAVPMIVGGNVIGVFDVQSDVVGRFGESDINIQTTLAAQVATSIQNVRSFEQSKAQADLESLVNVIGQRIQRTTSIEETLQTAIRELGTAIGASRVKASIKRAADGGAAEVVLPPEPPVAVLEHDERSNSDNLNTQVA